jgi:hypothetical protein
MTEKIYLPLPASPEDVENFVNERFVGTLDLACDHGVTFDNKQAEGLTAADVRKRWPRFSGQCPRCGYVGIAYASYAHMLAGDW